MLFHHLNIPDERTNGRFPFMRRQTLAGKAFLVMGGTIFGMIYHADKYLLAWEHVHRIEEERWRGRARRALVGGGRVPDESGMREWRRVEEERVRIEQEQKEVE